ncbi:MAG: flagellar hook assembly protein FlgD [Alphaproteobacteria bacterium]|nr:flagellar hook assembly protein FlgD [Alphaproteobacteria bacterium]MCL2505512.1 flagellar hook assembly protein FlgD [Alphaproteobacteria bacterium]
MSVSMVKPLSQMQSYSQSSYADRDKTLAMNFDMYLRILITQLKNQDPTNAMDPNEFTSQLIQMQQVQAQIDNNKVLTQLIDATNAGALATGVNYIGNYVRAPSPKGLIELQDGMSVFGYSLPYAAAQADIVIRDSNGKAVALLPGTTVAGDNYVRWEGEMLDGNIAKDGAYTFEIAAKNSAGDLMNVSNFTGMYRVNSVYSNNDGTLTLVAGALSLLSTDVNGVYSPFSKILFN